jgi:hypothetical protein
VECKKLNSFRGDPVKSFASDGERWMCGVARAVGVLRSRGKTQAVHVVKGFETARSRCERENEMNYKDTHFI